LKKDFRSYFIFAFNEELINYYFTMAMLKVKDESAILQELEDLRHHKSGINWVKMDFDGESICLDGTGKGGFEEVVSILKDNEIKFVVVEVTIKGDEYNPVKFVLMTWVGPGVPPGVKKARAGGLRPDVLTFVKQKVGIAGEFQPAMRSDLSYSVLAAKLTRIARQDATDAEEKKHVIARAAVNSGDKSKSQAKLVNEDEIAAALKKVHKGEDGWAALAYVEGKKDEITYLSSGKGLDSLKSHFPEDKIVYAIVMQQVKETTSVVNKILLVTMVGPKTPPLSKARSGTHRSELADFIKGFIPFHSHYQALAADDLSEPKFLEKLRAP